jgi:hypothetical protein
VNQRIVFDAPQSQGYNGRCRIRDLEKEKNDQNINHWISAQYQEVISADSMKT